MTNTTTRASSLPTRLNPPQWSLLIRAEARETPIVDIPGWLREADAAYDDVLDLEQAGMLRVTDHTDGDPVGLPDTLPRAPSTIRVELSNRGRYVTRTRIGPQLAALRCLNRRSAGCTLAKLTKTNGVDLAVLHPLDHDGFIQTTALQNGVPTPMSLDEAVGDRSRRPGSIVLRITTRGVPYAEI